MVKDKRKTRSKTTLTSRSTSKSKANRTERATPAVRVPRSALLVVEDELDDLAAVLNLLPELRMTARVMRDILSPPRGHLSGSADRIGEAARELSNQRLERYLTLAGKSFVQRSDIPTPTDLAEAAEMITGAVQWRLYRLAAVIRLLHADR